MHVWLIMFILGGSIGFILACIIAAGRVADLMRENQRLRRELERHQYESKVVAEQSQSSTPKPSVTLTSPRPRLNTVSDT